MSNRYYSAIMHNFVIVLIYNLCMTLFFYFLLNKFFSKSRFSQNQLNLSVEKLGKKQSLSTEERAPILTSSNLKFSVHQITKRMKVSKTAAHNAIMK